MNHLLLGHETERLKFRLLVTEDFDSWLPIFKEKDVAKFLGMDPSLSPEKLCEEWFKKSFSRYDNDEGGMNVLIHKETGEFVGQSGILIQQVEEEQRYEVGYSILPKFWKQGYAHEASYACLCHAFEKNLAPNIISLVHVDNIGSAKVAEKNGMTIEKRIESFEGSDPLFVYSIDRETWKKGP